MHLSPAGSGVVLPFPLPNTAAIPPPPDVTRTPPTVTVGLPDGGQAQVPGVLWPNPAVWKMAQRPARTGRPPIEIRQATRRQANELTGAWHDLGAETRPFA